MHKLLSKERKQSHCLSSGRVKQVGPPSQPIQSSSPLKTLTLIPASVKEALVSENPSIIMQLPGDIAKTFVLNVLLDLNSSTGA